MLFDHMLLPELRRNNELVSKVRTLFVLGMCWQHRSASCIAQPP